MNIGEKIRKLRKERKLTIVELANLTKLSKTTISDTETGKTNPSNDTILKISKSLNVDIEDLCKDTGYSFFFFFDEEENNLSNTTKKEIVNSLCCKQADEEDDKKYKEILDSINQNENTAKEKMELKFNDPIKAMEFILSQPSIMNYGNFDINKLSDKDKINFANDLLNMIKMISPKYSK